MLICRYIFAWAYILYIYTVHFFLNVFILIHLYLSHELCNYLIFTLQLILACLPPTSSLSLSPSLFSFVFPVHRNQSKQMTAL